MVTSKNLFLFLVMFTGVSYMFLYVTGVGFWENPSKDLLPIYNLILGALVISCFGFYAILRKLEGRKK